MAILLGATDVVPPPTADELAESDEFRLQLAALVDFFGELIMATYALEGDGPTAFVAWDVLQIVANSFSENTKPKDSLLPPTKGAISSLFSTSRLWAADLPRARAVIEPAYAYFKQQLIKHKKAYKLMEMISVFCPWNASNLTLAHLTYLADNKFISQAQVAAVSNSNEIDQYKNWALHSDRQEVIICCNRPSVHEFLKRDCPNPLLAECRVWRFWYLHQRRLPLLSLLVKVLGSLQFHSAGAERCFSLYRHDTSALMSKATAETTEVRLRCHYDSTVNPMRTLELESLAILPAL